MNWCKRVRMALARPTVESWRVIDPMSANSAASVWELYT